MTEKMLYKAKKREKRFQFFLTAALLSHALALVMFFPGVRLGGICGCVSAGLFVIGALFSGIAGIHANFFWAVTESVIASKEAREKLLELYSELE